MTTTEFIQMLATLADRWTDRDYDTVASHFSSDVFYSDSLNYTFRDSASLLEFFRDDDGKPQYCRFRNCVFDVDRQLGSAEYTYEGTFRYHGTVWIELKDHKITTWREYQHRSEKDWEVFWGR